LLSSNSLIASISINFLSDEAARVTTDRYEPTGNEQLHENRLAGREFVGCVRSRRCTGTLPRGQNYALMILNADLSRARSRDTGTRPSIRNGRRRLLRLRPTRQTSASQEHDQVSDQSCFHGLLAPRSMTVRARAWPVRVVRPHKSSARTRPSCASCRSAGRWCAAMP
jgi:hypothetical protein